MPAYTMLSAEPLIGCTLSLLNSRYPFATTKECISCSLGSKHQHQHQRQHQHHQYHQQNQQRSFTTDVMQLCKQCAHVGITLRSLKEALAGNTDGDGGSLRSAFNYLFKKYADEHSTLELGPKRYVLTKTVPLPTIYEDEE